MDFCGKSSGVCGFWKHSGLWIGYNFWRGFQIVPVLKFGSWVLNEIWIIDLSSALTGMLMSSSKLFLFLKEFHVGDSFIGMYSVVLIKHVAYLGEINSSIHIYQITFQALLFCFQMWLRFRIWTKILADQQIWWKKSRDWQICIPLFTPSTIGSLWILGIMWNLAGLTKWSKLCKKRATIEEINLL